MRVLVDSSVWIGYFRGDEESTAVDTLIDDGLLVTNDVILSELIPPLTVRNQFRLISLLKAIRCEPMDVDWDQLVALQVECIRKGINGVGLPDLMIAQQVMKCDFDLYTYDKHFHLISKETHLRIYDF